MTGPPESSDQNCHDQLSSETIHNLRAPLTVIKAQGQMLARWVRRNDIDEAEVVLRRLEVIDTMVGRLVAELEDLRETPSSHDQRGPSSNGRSES